MKIQALGFQKKETTRSNPKMIFGRTAMNKDEGLMEKEFEPLRPFGCLYKSFEPPFTGFPRYEMLLC